MLNPFILSLKRTLRTVYFPVLMVILTISMCMAALMGSEQTPAPNGVYSHSESDSAKRILAYLEANGFTVFESEEALRSHIKRGDCNCAAIIPRDIDERLDTGELDGAVISIVTPSSVLPELFRGHVAAALFGEYAPYITAGALSDSDITKAEVLAKYQAMMASGASFTFETETVSAVKAEELAPRNNVIGVSALLIFAMMMYSVCDTLRLDIAPLGRRVGIKKTLLYAVLPTMTSRILLTVISTLAAALFEPIIHKSPVIFPLVGAIAVYTVLTAILGLLFAAVLGKAEGIQIFTFYILIAALIFCPIYIDIAIAYPIIGQIRWIAVPYLLWVISTGGSALILAVLSSVLLLPAVFLLLKMRFGAKKSGKAKLDP